MVYSKVPRTGPLGLDWFGTANSLSMAEQPYRVIVRIKHQLDIPLKLQKHLIAVSDCSMAEKILYGHSSSSESVGYGVIARSIASKPSSTLSIDALMQRLRIRPADLKEQYGWIWLPFDHNRRVLSRMQSITNDVGQTLEIRMIIFSVMNVNHLIGSHFISQKNYMEI
ncbi:MAG: hypothetical protein R3C11_01465 [Planctomycetaceae bacterium]